MLSRVDESIEMVWARVENGLVPGRRVLILDEVEGGYG